MDSIKSYIALKEQLDRAQRHLSQTEGAINQLLEQMKEELGHRPTDRELKFLINDLKKKSRIIKKQYEKSLNLFQKKWSKELGAQHE